MEDGKYRKLQERLDMLSYGYPATESGVELKILKHLFSEKDAEVFLLLDQLPELPEEIARRADRDPVALTVHLENMAGRGLLFRVKTGEDKRYAAIGFVAGIYEFQVGSMNREMAELYEQYSEEAFHRATAETLDTRLRVVPVNEVVDTMPQVASYEDARNFLKKMDKIVVAECICRKQRGLINQGCDKPREVCLLSGPFGQTYLDMGMGREISVEGALRILEQAQDAGLVTQVSLAQNPGGMCNCCGDCCQALGALNRFAKPAEMVFSNYFASVEKSLCMGCQTCLDRCQMAAIVMDEDELAEVNFDRCIGCGLCVSTCPAEAIILSLKPEDQRRIPPITLEEMFVNMSKKRGLL